MPQKLGIKAGARLGLVRAPGGFERTLGELPIGVVTQEISAGRAKAAELDVIVCFATTLKEVARDLPALRRRLHPAGGLWMAWPKKASGIATDVGENAIRQIGLGAGLVDNKVCAIDEVWSGLRFVVRLADRPKRAG